MYAGFVGLYRFVVAGLRVRWFLVGRDLGGVILVLVVICDPAGYRALPLAEVPGYVVWVLGVGDA